MKSGLKDGLTEKERFSTKTPPRAETSEMTQRPKATTKTVKDERGTFKDKC